MKNLEVEQNYEWFLKHHDQLVKRYGDKTLLLRDRNVIGAFDDFHEAYEFAIEKGFIPGDFSIQKLNQEPIYIYETINDESEPLMTLYGITRAFDDNTYYNTSEERDNNLSDNLKETAVTISYYPKFASQDDVFCIETENGTKNYYCYSGENFIGRFDSYKTSCIGKYVWEGDYGFLDAEYQAFQDRGLNIDNPYEINKNNSR